MSFSTLFRRGPVAATAVSTGFRSVLDAEDYLACGYFGEERVLQALPSLGARQRRMLLPPEQVVRAPPTTVLGDAQSTVTYLPAFFEMLGGAYGRLPPVAICKLDDAAIVGSSVGVVERESVDLLYETSRPNDRAALEDDDPRRRMAEAKRLDMDRRRSPVFVGSPGSANYGHWLVDDLPRILLAMEAIAGPISLLMPAAGRRMDRVRVEALRWLAAGRDVDVRFLPGGEAVRVRGLRYVTPVSYHPIAKSRPALERLRTAAQALPPPAEPRRRIVVLRGAGHGRQIINEAEALARLARRGFQPVDVSQMGPEQQARTLQSAEAVVGVMGAAMCNVVFAPPALPILHICPSGWNEPFYWDLADRLRQPYHTLLCGPDRGAAAYNSDFTVNLDRLDQALDRLLATT